MMKAPRLMFLAAWLLFSGAALAQIHPSILTFPEETFSPSRAETAVLSNGIRVFLVEDHEIPVVTVQAYIRGGSYYDPAGKEGLASLTVTCLRAGGTKRWAPDVLDEELEHRAVRLSAWAGGEMINGSVNALAKDFDWALDTFADVMLRPAFRAANVKVERAQMLDSVARRWDRPGTIMSHKFSEVMYGKDSPEARRDGKASLSRITVKDMRAFHARHFAPRHIMLGAYGDFDTPELLRKLEAAFGALPAGGEELPELPAITHRAERKIYYVHRPGLKQTHIRLGHLGVNRHDPDMRRIEVMNNIFSGGMGARLFSKIRTEKGLAYSVWGNLGGGRDRGAFSVGCQTKPESTLEAVEAMLAETARLRAEPPTAEEMERARRTTVNGFVFQFEDASDVLWKTVSNVFYGYPPDYWETYLDKIRAVTPEEVQAVAQKHIHSDNLFILVVGDEALFGEGKSLSALGEVVPLTLD
jgi:zinc protease